ncbi:16S rRNA (cytidine(1402)-2'-O)-methyltransferase [Desulfovibrio inopinatus]|uniref:16S rRNA (cytidine(1402)-2'-O)-methyltransferase n=1 Tax=Desulfovibrio inopinatus TaxID=102109 RepID=UPI000404D90B|nr:16S rRNA (cytidine(1402)-2'-O)-methyltransferase [Desulfovibrio inopinatus]
MEPTHDSDSAVLYVVATPLGNIDDLSPRAKAILEDVDYILAEDTRRTGMLLKRLGVSSNRFLSFHDHNEENRVPQVLALLEQGKQIALVSDAGTPLVSDPGFELVRALRSADIRVSPIPGPSAVVTALSVSGLAPIPFSFLGFLPRKTSERRMVFEAFSNIKGSLIFFERKNRLQEAFSDILAVLGDRPCLIAREMTKKHEEFLFDTASGFLERPLDILGEVTVVIGPAEQDACGPSTREEALDAAKHALTTGVKPRQAAKSAAQHLCGWTPKAVYELMDSLKHEKE